MTQIDRYLLSLFLRMIAVCFASVAGVFIVFHAFSNLNSLVDLAGQRDSTLIAVAASFYGPYLLWLFDLTGAMIALMALLCAVAWVRRTGELTALLSAGVSHGRILRPLILAAGCLVVLQFFSREFLLPKLRSHLALTADLTGDAPQPILPNYDYVNELLLDGESIPPKQQIGGSSELSHRSGLRPIRRIDAGRVRSMAPCQRGPRRGVSLARGLASRENRPVGIGLRWRPIGADDLPRPTVGRTGMLFRCHHGEHGNPANKSDPQPVSQAARS